MKKLFISTFFLLFIFVNSQSLLAGAQLPTYELKVKISSESKFLEGKVRIIDTANSIKSLNFDTLIIKSVKINEKLINPVKE
ncbi:hypothetical protein ACFL20_13750, partial [Spirochaetota bacterium]